MRYVVGALALVAVMALLIWVFGGMIIACLGIAALVGAVWGTFDERRHKRQYEEDMKDVRSSMASQRK